MDGAGLPRKLKIKLWGEAFLYGVEWWDVTIKRDQNHSPCKRWINKLPNWTKNENFWRNWRSEKIWKII